MSEAMTDAEVAARLAGAWRLTSFTMRAPDGSVTEPLGHTPGGQISYGADGHMSAHLAKGPGATGTPPMADYAGYYGDFSVDAGAAIITHHVIGASGRDLIGTDLPRRYRFEGDRLILSATLPRGEAELVWTRKGGHA